MNFLLTHILFAATYIVIGTAVAGLLPAIAPVAPGTALYLGGGTVALAAFIHLLLVQHAGRAAVEREIVTLQGDQDALRQNVREMDSEIAALKESGVDSAQSAEDVVAEMKVLQTLLAEVVSQAQGNPNFRETLKLARTESGAEPEPDLADREVLEIMRNALAANRVDLYLQPVMSLPARKTVSYETYSRVRDETGLTVYPRQYVHLAEREGLISTLDNMLLFRCVQVLRQLRKRRPDMPFFVNISSGTLSDEQFFGQFVDFISRNPELPEQIIFEIPQSDVVGADAVIDSRLEALAEIGFALSMDHVTDLDIDFHDLARRRFKYVKIGAPLFFEGDGPLHKTDYKDAFKRQGIQLVIEKIETEPALVELLDYDIDMGQGFLFGAPQRVDPEEGKDLA